MTKYFQSLRNYDNYDTIMSIAGGAGYSVVCDHLCVAALFAGIVVARLIKWRACPAISVCVCVCGNKYQVTVM